MPGLDLTSMGNAFLYLTAFLGAFLAALWLGLVFWVYRDIRSRTQDRLLHLLAPLLAFVLGPPGLVIYAILRPPSTLDEIYQRTLEEEALLSSIEEHITCPGCGGHTHHDWQLCPSCHTRLRKPCTHCGELMELAWQICPRCGTAAPGVRTTEIAPEIQATGD